LEPASDNAALSGLLEELAATLPEIFGTLDTGCLERIAARLGVEPGGESFGEVLLLSESHVHVMHPLRSRPGEALVAVSPASRSIGLILSQAHARVSVLESK
jgi:hypothetical protein